MLIQANSGGGKSRAIRQLLEETHGRVQHLVLDPEGEFGTLRERFDYVLAGKEGDVPAVPKAAKLLSRRLVELGASAIIDLYDLNLTERREFVRLFLTELMALPRSLWHPILVVIDEAHLFAPERGSGESQASDAVISLCTQGRKRGFAAVLATQRISKLHKDAAAELLNKLIGRTGLDVDMKRAGDELGLDKEGRRALARLAPGEFYAYGPAISPEIQVVRTGNVTTTHPEAGRLASPPPPAPAKVRAMLAQLADLPQQAEEEARTVADLHRQLREAQAKIRKAERNGPEKIVEKVVVDERAVARAVDAAVKPLLARADRTKRAAEKVSGALATLLAEVGAPMPEPSVAAPTRAVASAPPRATAPRPADPPAEGVTAPQQKILDVLLAFEAISPARAPSKSNVAVFAGVSSTSGGYFNNLGRLRGLGLIDYPSGGTVALTNAGRSIARPSVSVESQADLLAAWVARIPAPQARVLEALAAIYPEAIAKDALAEQLGVSPTSGGYFNNLGALRSLGVIDYPSPGMVAATDLLFPDGLS